MRLMRQRGSWILCDEVREEVTKEVQEQDIRTVVEMFQEYHETKENAVTKIRSKFPECADRAEELLEKYWQDCIC